MSNQIERDKAKAIVKKLYKTELGHPFPLTDSQADIFNAIFKKKDPRVFCMTSTQYGKSDIVGMAVLTRVCTFPEKWCITAGTEKQAAIIMGYAIKHIFENDFTKLKLTLKSGESLARLKEEKSKMKLTFTFKDGRKSTLFILGASGGRTDPIEAGNQIMGFGSPNIIEDESALIIDVVQAKIMRMLGGHRDNFLMKIGNPFRRGHFYKSFVSDRYKNIVVDYLTALEEGRYTMDFIREMQDEPLFSVLYECKFPPGEKVDSQGWIPLLTDEQIDAAQSREVQSVGVKRMGADVSEGGDENVGIIRTENFMYIRHRDNETDQMRTAENFVEIMDLEYIKSQNFFMDGIGNATGVAVPLREMKPGINTVINSEAADEPLKFYNKRAENAWRLKRWIETGGTLEKDKGWDELKRLRYRVVDARGKIQLIPKRILLREGDSPNIAEGACYTFDDHKPHNRAYRKKKIKKTGSYMSV